MSETVVYILGAGFSAPLGLPVMSNFVLRSKDLYAADPEKYKHFTQVFNRLDSMSKVKNFYSADLSNIEEVLSILEMDASLSGQRLRRTFLSYISGVIEGLTPAIEPYPTGMPGNWNDFVFGGASVWKKHGEFVANLFRLQVTRFSNPSTLACSASAGGFKYHVITLNYDLVLESVLQFLGDQYRVQDKLEFHRPADKTRPDLDQCVALCKLHGSVDGQKIVPPTWNKALRRDILPEWTTAHAALAEANHIRIVGYSLPDGDAYFRYLMKAGVLRSSHLKTIDVVCMDDARNSVESRYRAFVDFPFFRFKNGTTQEYLGCMKTPEVNRQTASVKFNTLESAHNSFFV